MCTDIYAIDVYLSFSLSKAVFTYYLSCTDAAGATTKSYSNLCVLCLIVFRGRNTSSLASFELEIKTPGFLAVFLSICYKCLYDLRKRSTASSEYCYESSFSQQVVLIWRVQELCRHRMPGNNLQEGVFPVYR